MCCPCREEGDPTKALHAPRPLPPPSEAISAQWRMKKLTACSDPQVKSGHSQRRKQVVQLGLPRPHRQIGRPLRAMSRQLGAEMLCQLQAVDLAAAGGPPPQGRALGPYSSNDCGSCCEPAWSCHCSLHKLGHPSWPSIDFIRAAQGFYRGLATLYHPKPALFLLVPGFL